MVKITKKQILGCKKWDFPFSLHMEENLLHHKTEHISGLISVGLSSSYCTCHVLKGAQTHKKNYETSQNARRT